MNSPRFALPSLAILAALGLAIAVTAPQPAFAAKGQKVGSSKAPANQRTQAQVKKSLNQNIKRQNMKIETLSRRLSDHAAALKIAGGMPNDKGAWKVVKKTINEHHAARKELTRLTTTTYANYAQQNGWRMVPNPPSSAPPPLPPAQLAPPAAKETLKQPKAKRPTGAR